MSIICKICNKECSTYNVFYKHIKEHNIDVEQYYLKYLSTDPKDGYCHGNGCTNTTNFKSITVGFRKFCSIKCSSNTDLVKDKRKNAIMEKYGVENISQLDLIKEKKKLTCLSNYGVENPAQSSEICDKIKNTNIERYNCENPAQNKEVYNKIKQTCIDKYGHESAMQSDKVKEKCRNTCLEKYGKEYSLQAESVREKSRLTIFKKYGVYNVSQSKEIINIKAKSFFDSLFTSDRFDNKVIPNFTIDDYKGVEHKYSWKCTKCNSIFEDHMDNGRTPRCRICYPNIAVTSNMELELYNFIKGYCPDSIHNNRSVIYPLELDIYVPSKQIAIEFDGLYWHSEINGKDKNYHLNKTNKCSEYGVKLIHIFEDEWIDKQEIVKSVLLSKLGMISNRIYARTCDLREVNNTDGNTFLNNNHLQGSINGKHIGLYHDDKLVCILTYGKPRFNNNYETEVLRFCNKINTTVIGGLSKLLSHIKSNSIISYVDRRFGDGNSYKNMGFNLTGTSDPSYYYIKDGFRYNRIKFQKHKLPNILENFDILLTEWENMKLSGYDRIWDCGNYVYSLNR